MYKDYPKLFQKQRKLWNQWKLNWPSTFKLFSSNSNWIIFHVIFQVLGKYK